MDYTLMNLLSSHDVSRVRSMLARDFDPRGMSRAAQAVFELSEEEFALGGRRQRLAAAIQYALPGVPSVYYGDEVGMTGLLDPFNRRTWREEDAEIREWYIWLGRLRREYAVLRTGHVRFFSTDGNILGILRYAMDGRDYFGREIGRDAILTVVNPSAAPRRIVFDLGEVYETLPPEEDDEALRKSAWEAVSLRSGDALPLLRGLIEIDMPPHEAEVFALKRDQAPSFY
jgi:glycosidase